LIINTERFLAKKSHALIAISDKQKSELAEEFHIADKAKFKVIPLGFELKNSQRTRMKRKKFRTNSIWEDEKLPLELSAGSYPLKIIICF
jgi:hypothetical protein